MRDSVKLNLADGAEWLTEAEIEAESVKHSDLLSEVKKGHLEYKSSLGWLDIETWAGKEWIERYQQLAKKVQDNADVLIVVGIGGSNQAARAVVEGINKKDGVQIIWAGNNISAFEINEVLASVEDKSVFVNVIAKNFETLEPGIGFRAIRRFMKEKYGSEYSTRIICTGTEDSHFHNLCVEHGFVFLPFPKDVGGRFTALTPIGLFPLAAAGMDIERMIEGASRMRNRIYNEDAAENIAVRYAVIRNLLYKKGFRMEMMSFFEPRLFRLAKWWVQLFGESEGKDNKGLYPLIGNFSEDLHSIGQFLQEGSLLIFETFINIETSESSHIVNADEVDDCFGYLDGKDFADVNKAAYEATIAAHSERYPCMSLTVEKLDEKTFGALFYFYEFSCYLSAKILGVNPFDQPGVEAYKNHMFQILGK